jgi:hypothetical protein
MNKLLLPALLLLAAITGMAQNKAVIKGRVVDSVNNSPVVFATVAILNVQDTTSTLVAYTLCDKNGSFSFHNPPTGIPLKIFISSVSYNPFRKNLTLNKAESLDMGIIKVGPKQLHEVVIRGERDPVTIRADTIEFAAEAFKTRPNALVEDLLKKLPGVEVDNQGFIIVNGKQVSKVLVDGHEFFNNDTRIATKNLDADMIDKIQVYDDRENDPNHLIPEPNVGKIINLKFKKAYKKSIFGKIYGGTGTEGRYEAGGLLNMFRDTLQVSLLGVGNNLNNTGFSFNDLYTSGGLNRGGFNAFGIGSSNGAGNGIQKIISSGVNINNDYGKKLKINLAYYYSHTVNTYNSITNTQRLLSDTDLTTNTANARLRTDNRHNITMLIRWQPDEATEFTYNPDFSYSANSSGSNSAGNTFSNFIPRINQSGTTDNNTGNNAQFQQSLSYNHQFKKSGESINISSGFQISPNGGDDYNNNNLISYTAIVPSYILNRYTNTNNKNTDVNLAVSYRYPITKKLIANVTVSDDYRHQVNNTEAYDLDTLTGHYDTFLPTLSSALTRNLWTENINPGLTYNFKQNSSLALNANAQILQVSNKFDRGLPDIDQHFFNLLPNANLSVGKFSLGYQSSFTLPNIGDMIPYSIIFSPLYSVTGNPDLKPSRRNNFILAYNNYLQSGVMMRANASASFEENGIFRQRTLDAAGVETSTPINMNGRYTLSAGGFISKKFKKRNELSFNENTNLSVNKSHSFFELNGQNGSQDTYSISLNQSFSVNWKDIIEIEPSYRLTDAITNYTGINYNNINNVTHVADTHFIFYWTKSTSIEGTYTYTYNPLVSPGYQKSANFLNLNIAHTLLKKNRGQIKISCYDILNQNISSVRYISENTITDTQSQILKRYFLLTLQYKFNKSLSK